MKKIIRFLLKYYEGLYVFIFMFFAVSLSNSYIQLRIPIISQVAIDKWIQSVPENDELYALAIRIFIMLLFTILFGMINRYLGAYLSSTVGLRVRKDTIKHIQRLPLTYLDDKRTGDLITRSISDVESISDILYKVPDAFLNAAFLLTGSIITMYAIDTQLTTVLIIVIPVFVFMNAYLAPRARRLHRKTRTEYGHMISNAEGIFSGIRVVKTLNNYQFLEDKFNDSGANYKKLELKAAILDGLFRSSEILMREGFRLITIVYGGFKVANGDISVGELILFQALMFAFLRPINILIQLLPDVLRSLGSFDKLNEIIEMEEEKYDGETISNLEGKIELSNLNFSYIKKDNYGVLKGINLKINPGEKIGIVGHTGCGKTTICNLLVKFYKVDNDSIFLDGVDINTLSTSFIRDNIGMVQQEVHIFASSIKENLLIAKPDATDEELHTALAFAEAEDFVALLPNGIDTFVGERGLKLSGGQKQRISIARIFLKNPKILILDESTSSLDNQTENSIQSTLEKLEKNRTIISVAHRLTTIVNCDKIVVLNNGVIEEIGSHTDLLADKGFYYNLYNSGSL